MLSEEQRLLLRIRSKANTINFSRLGKVSPDDRDDLKQISGIGGLIEKKLNALGVYTFEQLGRMIKEDEEAVNQAIEHFPGRIRKDKWSKQAKRLAKKKKSN